MQLIVKSRYRYSTVLLTAVICSTILDVACLVALLFLLSKPQIGIVTTLFE